MDTINVVSKLLYNTPTTDMSESLNFIDKGPKLIRICIIEYVRNSEHSVMTRKMLSTHIILVILMCQQVAAPPSCSSLRVLEEDPGDGFGWEGQYDLIPTNFTSPVYQNAEKDK